MPPKAKFTKEEVITAAVSLIREGKAVTARDLGAKLGSSARPIFTLFHGMEEVLQAAERAVRSVYNGYIEEGLREPLAFKGVGRAYIRFAMREPQFFRLLFMGKHDVSIRAVLPELDENYEKILSSITSSYDVDRETANGLYRHLWIYSHGIAAMCATGTCSYTEEETDGMLTEIFVALLVKAKQGGKK